MKNYKVTFTKYETYYVQAENLDEAEKYGFDMLDNDKLAFLLDPVDAVEVTEIEGMQCPKCKNLYKTEISICPKCNIELTNDITEF